MGLFTKFSMPFDFSKKTKALPKPIETPNNSFAEPYKTLATFELNINTPRYSGDIPDATIKFYPLD